MMDIISIITNVNEKISACLIFDATNITIGPICTLELPHQVCSGTHATWAQMNEILKLSPVYILESIRTPRGKAKESGGLYELSPYELLDSLYNYISKNEYVDFNKIDDVPGCVTQQGEQAGNIAKSSASFQVYQIK